MEQPGFVSARIRFDNLNLELSVSVVDRRYNKIDNWLTFEPTNLDNLSPQLVIRGIKQDPFDAVAIYGHPIYTRIGLPSLG